MGLKVVVGRQHAGADQLFLQYPHEVQQVLRLATTNVVHPVGRHGQTVLALAAFGRASHHPHYAFNDVINISEVATAVAVVVYLYGLASQELIGEAEIGHVGPASRPIDGEEPQTRGRDIVQLAVAVGKEFVALLSCGV